MKVPTEFLNPKRRKLVEEYYSNKLKDVEILIDNVFDPHNVAALSRTADGLGIKTINLYYTYNPFPNFEKDGKKSSSSASKWINFNKITHLNDFVKKKKKEKYQFIAADGNELKNRLDKYKFPKKCIIMFGSEKNGLSKELKEIADDSISIPLVGMVESYNISVAAAIIAYEIFKQKGEKLSLTNGKPQKTR